MKKIIAVIIAVLLLGSQLVSCTKPIEEAEPIDEVSDQTQIAVPLQATETTLAEGEIIITTADELLLAAQDASIKKIFIRSAVVLSSEMSFERNDDLEIIIEESGSLEINEYFNPVGCVITNHGSIVVGNTFERGIANLINFGMVTVRSGGVFTSGMSTAENRGSFIIEENGKLSIDRGSYFENYGDLVNNGMINISEGGQLNDMGGSIENNGNIDLYSFFNGDITKINGSGSINDHRE
jgi:hypothetical protein